MSLRMLHLQNEARASCPDLRGENYRASFHNHSSAKGPRKKIYHGHLEGKGPRKGESAVVKMFRSDAGTEEMCDAEIEKHKLARRLAQAFNKTVPDQRYKIQFTLPLKSTVERLGVGFYLTRHRHRHMDRKEWVLIEENLVRKGEYKVFIRKTGERLGDDPTTLDAFLHYTYNESNGHYLMCGLQGVQTDSGYMLTTPCIHSTDKSFGDATDKGPKWIRKVFKHHHCNNLCYSFLKMDPTLGLNENGEEDMDEEDELGDNNGDKNDDNDDDYHMDLIEHELGEDAETGEIEGKEGGSSFGGGLRKNSSTLQEECRLLRQREGSDDREYLNGISEMSRQPSV